MNTLFNTAHPTQHSAARYGCEGWGVYVYVFGVGRVGGGRAKGTVRLPPRPREDSGVHLGEWASDLDNKKIFECQRNRTWRDHAMK